MNMLEIVLSRERAQVLICVPIACHEKQSLLVFHEYES